MLLFSDFINLYTLVKRTSLPINNAGYQHIYFPIAWEGPDHMGAKSSYSANFSQHKKVKQCKLTRYPADCFTRERG
jgi:hypothetical protein